MNVYKFALISVAVVHHCSTAAVNAGLCKHSKQNVMFLAITSDGVITVFLCALSLAKSTSPFKVLLMVALSRCEAIDICHFGDNRVL